PTDARHLAFLAVALEGGLGLLGFPESAAGLGLDLAQAASGAVQDVEVVLLIGYLLLASLGPLGVDQGQPLLHPLTAIACHLLGLGQLGELLGPLVAVAAWGQAAAEPAQAVLLDGHQHR